ncbi:ABC transporter permease [Cellulomonas bogoriensis]|uniref:ABC transporter permease n=1 Tax=Cellulomonas bogoriensis 69B4 = DSM 16987 TaxID=1386082 RepID=A0A0A0C484_9CELL|nr:ABC transporter permease subunit [Cellulomonas bogoriensis]KGM14174.1 ABC transporter permease [Cellulomonas bogoriensis 69B4 = DSM 16987]
MTATMIRWSRALRLPDAALGLLGLLGLALLWELYKALGPADGWSIGGTRVLPRTTDLAMPHTWDVLIRLGEPLTAAPGAPPLWVAVAQASLFSLGIALAGWAIGVVVGFALAVLMARVRVAENAVLPLVVLSQTVPLIALAPVVRSWGSRIQVAGVTWEAWMSVAVIASYLAFFPVAVGALRGLQSPETLHTELMRAYGTGWWTTLVRLRLPASVPYVLPALRLAAANAVVGTVVAEVSTGLPGGVGRMILEFANFASSDPARPWAPLMGAVALGLLVAGLVGALGLPLARYRRTEVPA